MIQLALQLDPPRTKRMTLLEMVSAVMLEASRDRRYLAPFEVQRQVQVRWEEFHSDSTITARMRQLRSLGYFVDRRMREGSKTVREYMITGVKQ